MGVAFDASEHWRIEHESGTTVVDSVFSGQPAPKVGGTPSWTLGFRGSGCPTPFRDRFGAIYGFHENAGSYAADVTMPDNVVVYTEQVAPDDESLLVALRPPDGDPRLRGAWGLIEDVKDKTEPPLTDWRLELSLTYISPLARYVDRAAVRAEHERRGFH